MEIWQRSTLQRKLLYTYGILTALIFVELGILLYSLQNLSATRAFVYGESVWSKAQKDSAYHFSRYLSQFDPQDYAAYERALYIPHECRKSRLELYRPDPDEAILRRGFTEGKIPESEVGPILHLLQAYSWLPHIQNAMRIWRRGDELLQDYEALAEKVHGQILDGQHPTPEEIGQIMLRLDDLNFKIGVAEDEFSLALQDGARWLEGVVRVISVLIVLFIGLCGLLLIYFLGREIRERVSSLIRSSERIGNLSWRPEAKTFPADELGHLEAAVARMGKTIVEASAEKEKTIKERTLELELAIKNRDEFYAIASHELRTPVTGLLLSLQFLLKRLDAGASSEELRRSLEKSTEMTLRLSSLQNTLLDVAKLGSSKLNLNFRTVDVAKILLESIEEFQAPEQRQLIYFRTPVTEILASCDPQKLKQVFVNLVSNALKYGGGSPILVEVLSSEGEAIVRVTDGGKGVPVLNQNSIFEQFVRGDEDKGISGLGMGLYIARKIIEAHSGSLILVESTGTRTTFQVKLPLQR